MRQRVFRIACGYEDANNSNDLRRDPALKVACDRLPISVEELASQPTISRLENGASRTDLYRMALALVDTFLASYKKAPEAILLDIDDTTIPHTAVSSWPSSTVSMMSIATCRCISTRAKAAS